MGSRIRCCDHVIGFGARASCRSIMLTVQEWKFQITSPDASARELDGLVAL
jgi:hypothetical protein